MLHISKAKELVVIFLLVLVMILCVIYSGSTEKYVLENDAGITLRIQGNRYSFFGKGEEYDQLVDYLGGKKGVWDQSAYKKAQKADKGNRSFSTDEFEINMEEDARLIITKKEYTSSCYRFVKQ